MPLARPRLLFATALAALMAAPLGAQDHDHSHHMSAPAAPTAPSFSQSEADLPLAAEPRQTTPDQPETPPLSTPIPNGGLPALAPADPPSAPPNRLWRYLDQGGPAIWAISALSVLALAVILWKIWRFVLIGAWARGRAKGAVALWEKGEHAAARARVARARTLRARVLRAAFDARTSLSEDSAREETTRVARNALADAAGGLRALELIATIAPLLGLLGTVLGMIAAFQTLQHSGNQADPSVLAGGIWEALLTTAAGMAVAIPVSAALTWFETVIEHMRRDVEDAATRIFVAPAP